MSTTAEIIAKLEAEAFDAEEMARVWGGESQCAPPLRAAAARLSELERENAALREALKPFASQCDQWAYRLPDTQGFGLICLSSPADGDIVMDADITMGDLRRARAALAGSGEK